MVHSWVAGTIVLVLTVHLVAGTARGVWSQADEAPEPILTQGVEVDLTLSRGEERGQSVCARWGRSGETPDTETPFDQRAPKHVKSWRDCRNWG
jgi:hypothetical protein